MCCAPAVGASPWGILDLREKELKYLFIGKTGSLNWEDVLLKAEAVQAGPVPVLLEAIEWLL